MDWLLVLLLLVSNIFWVYNTQKLINKLMSRNFYEYLQTESAFKSKPTPPPKPPEVDDALEQAEMLNGLLKG